MNTTNECIPRITTVQTFVFTGVHKYVLLPDRASGRDDVYTVYALAETTDPVIIGRELPLAYAREYLCEFDACAQREVRGARWERRHINKVLAKVLEARRNQA